MCGQIKLKYTRNWAIKLAEMGSITNRVYPKVYRPAITGHKQFSFTNALVVQSRSLLFYVIFQMKDDAPTFLSF